MIFAAALLAFAPAGLDEAVRLASEGRFVAALEAAEREADPLRHAQAVARVRHHAGDLDGTLATLVAARAAGVDDAWIQDREAYVALSLRRAREARAGLDALERSLAAPGLAAESRARWSDAAARYRAELTALEATLAARDAALVRARALGISGAALLALGLAALALRAGPARPAP